jgi:hypothetical protein
MHLLKLLLLLAIVLGEVGCGLPYSYFLEPPSRDILASPTNNLPFQIIGTSRGNDTAAAFEGYELYYKFYGTDADTTADATRYESTGYTNIDLEQGGFHRLCLGPGSDLAQDTNPGTGSAPLVNIDAIGSIGASFIVNIRLNDENPPDPPVPLDVLPISYYSYASSAASSPTKYQEVRRFVRLPSGAGCKTFRSNHDSEINNFDPGLNDADLSGSTGQTIWTHVTNDNSGDIFVMLYALSYGKATDNTPVYSSPVYLGYTRTRVYE